MKKPPVPDDVLAKLKAHPGNLMNNPLPQGLEELLYALTGERKEDETDGQETPDHS